MKHTLTLTLAILLLAATGRGNTNDFATAEVLVGIYTSPVFSAGEDITADTDDLIIGTSPPPVAVVGDITVVPDMNGRITMTDDGIRKLAASGEICEVLGFHCWEQMPHVTLEYCPDGNYPQHRKCRICGKVETYKGEWK